MGFGARPTPRFGPDKWAATILLVILLGVGMMLYMPGTHSIEMAKALTIATTFGVSMGFAVLGAVVVAQRFIERHERDRTAFPPIAELVLAALIVVGLSIALRIGIPLVPALMQGPILVVAALALPTMLGDRREFFLVMGLVILAVWLLSGYGRPVVAGPTRST
jgi:hypothetical protein